MRMAAGASCGVICCPKRCSGMAEVGNVGLSPKLLAQCTTDRERIPKARRSDAACATVVLHVAPEAATGGPPAIVRDCDWVAFGSQAGTLELEVSDAEIPQRHAEREAHQARQPYRQTAATSRCTSTGRCWPMTAGCLIFRWAARLPGCPNIRTKDKAQGPRWS